MIYGILNSYVSFPGTSFSSKEMRRHIRKSHPNENENEFRDRRLFFEERVATTADECFNGSVEVRLQLSYYLQLIRASDDKPSATTHLDATPPINNENQRPSGGKKSAPRKRRRNAATDRDQDVTPTDLCIVISPPKASKASAALRQLQQQPENAQNSSAKPSKTGRDCPDPACGQLMGTAGPKRHFFAQHLNVQTVACSSCSLADAWDYQKIKKHIQRFHAGIGDPVDNRAQYNDHYAKWRKLHFPK